jgi:DNA-binding transcriptional LysR family regulator
MLSPRFTLRQLAYFVAAAEEGSVARAAGQLKLSQPSISSAIAKLEDQLGVQLLVRHHAQGVSLTPQGSRLLASARNLLHHSEEFQRQAASTSGEIAGPLHIASFATLAPAFMPALIAGFGSLYPSVRMAITEGRQDELIEGLRHGSFEMALCYDVDLPDDLGKTPLASFDPYILLPASHRLARRDVVSLHELKDEPMILLDVAPSRSYFLGLFRAQGIEPHVGFSSPSLELVRGMVGRGLGFSLLVTRPSGDHTYEGTKLAVRPILEPGTRGEVCLAALRALRPTRTMEAFEEFSIEYFRKAPGAVTP